MHCDPVLLEHVAARCKALTLAKAREEVATISRIYGGRSVLSARPGPQTGAAGWPQIRTFIHDQAGRDGEIGPEGSRSTIKRKEFLYLLESLMVDQIGRIRPCGPLVGSGQVAQKPAGSSLSFEDAAGAADAVLLLFQEAGHRTSLAQVATWVLLTYPPSDSQKWRTGFRKSKVVVQSRPLKRHPRHRVDVTLFVLPAEVSGAMCHDARFASKNQLCIGGKGTLFVSDVCLGPWAHTTAQAFSKAPSGSNFPSLVAWGHPGSAEFLQVDFRF